MRAVALVTAKYGVLPRVSVTLKVAPRNTAVCWRFGKGSSFYIVLQCFLRAVICNLHHNAQQHCSSLAV